MKAFITAMVMTLLAQGAWAESIYCSFTEPFITVIYNSDTSMVKVNSMEEGDFELKVNVEFQPGGKIVLTDADKTHSLLIDTSREGNDGMSDYIYPFEANLDGGMWGGCETDNLKKRM